MAIEPVENQENWTVRERAAEMEAGWLGYTLEKMTSQNFQETAQGGYRLLDEGELYKGENYGLSLADVEQLVKNERSNITERLLSELNETEEKVEARLQKLEPDLLRERLRIIQEYVEIVHGYLQVVDIYLAIVWSRLGEMDPATKEELKKMQLLDLNRQIKSMGSQQADVSCLLALRDQLELEIEKGETLRNRRPSAKKPHCS